MSVANAPREYANHLNATFVKSFASLQENFHQFTRWSSQYFRGRATKDLVALFDVLAKEIRLKLRKNDDPRNH